MYILLDYSDGQYSVRATHPSATPPPDFNENPNWVHVQDQVFVAWQLWNAQGVVFHQLWTALSNERFREDPP